MKKVHPNTYPLRNHIRKLSPSRAISVLLSVAICAFFAGAANICTGAAFVAGCNLFANELNVLPNNNIANVLPVAVVPDRTTVFKFISPKLGWQMETYEAADGFWVPGIMVLNPGDGAVVITPRPFVTAVPGVPLAAPLECKCMTKGSRYLLGRRAAGVGPSTYEDFAGVPPVPGATLYEFVPGPGQDCNTFAAPHYLIHTFVGGAWVPGAAPLVAADKAVWIEIPDVPPTMSVGAGFISWAGCWRLESTPALGGAWLPVPGATSPFAFPHAGGFYRLVCPID